MWRSHYCTQGFDASPCPVMGGLHPQFRAGPANGRVNGQPVGESAFMLLAECGECRAILGRERALGRILVWVPDDVEAVSRPVRTSDGFD